MKVRKSNGERFREEIKKAWLKAIYAKKLKQLMDNCLSLQFTQFSLIDSSPLRADRPIYARRN